MHPIPPHERMLGDQLKRVAHRQVPVATAYPPSGIALERTIMGTMAVDPCQSIMATWELCTSKAD
jgi:hypothetical protein